MPGKKAPKRRQGRSKSIKGLSHCVGDLCISGQVSDAAKQLTTVPSWLKRDNAGGDQGQKGGTAITAPGKSEVTDSSTPLPLPAEGGQHPRHGKNRQELGRAHQDCFIRRVFCKVRRRRRTCRHNKGAKQSIAPCYGRPSLWSSNSQGGANANHSMDFPVPKTGFANSPAEASHRDNPTWVLTR